MPKRDDVLRRHAHYIWGAIQTIFPKLSARLPKLLGTMILQRESTHATGQVGSSHVEKYVYKEAQRLGECSAVAALDAVAIGRHSMYSLHVPASTAFGAHWCLQWNNGLVLALFWTGDGKRTGLFVAWSFQELVDGGSVHWKCLTLNRDRAVIAKLFCDPCRTSPHQLNALMISPPFYQHERASRACPQPCSEAVNQTSAQHLTDKPAQAEILVAGSVYKRQGKQLTQHGDVTLAALANITLRKTTASNPPSGVDVPFAIVRGGTSVSMPYVLSNPTCARSQHLVWQATPRSTAL